MATKIVHITIRMNERKNKFKKRKKRKKRKKKKKKVRRSPEKMIWLQQKRKKIQREERVHLGFACPF